MGREEGRLVCGSPTTPSDVLSNPASAWVKAGPGPRGGGSSKGSQARCRLPRSSPRVRLKMTGSGGRRSWVRGGLARREAGEQLGSQGLEPQPSEGPARGCPSTPRVSEI